MRNISTSSYFNVQNSKDCMHSTNTKGPKKNWIPKVKKLSYDAYMLDSSKSNLHVDCNCSNHMIEEIMILSYFTPTRG